MQIIQYIRAALKVYNIPFAVLADGSTGYLSRSVNGSAIKWTYSRAIYIDGKTAQQMILSSNHPSSGDYFDQISIVNGVLSWELVRVGVAVAALSTTQVFKDPGWYILTFTYDSANATASERMRIDVGTTRITSFSTETYPSASYASYINSSTYPTEIGRFGGVYLTGYWGGTFAACYQIDNQALVGTDFCEDHATLPVYVAKKFAGSYGAADSYIDFAVDGVGTLGADLGKDVSGNGNHWTATGGLTQVTSTPTNVYPTLNPQDPLANTTYINGNLTQVVSAVAGRSSHSTLTIPEGKFVYEYTLADANDTYVLWGVQKAGGNQLAYCGSDTLGHAFYVANGGYMHNAVTTAYGTSCTTAGRTVQIAVHRNGTSLKVWAGHDQASLGTIVWQNSGDPTAGTNPMVDITINANDVWFFAGGNDGNLAQTIGAVNFGSTDYNLTVPTGFVSLCTDNLPTRSPKVPSTPQTGTVVCNGTTDNAFINLGMSPDKAGTSTVNAVPLVWGTNAIACANGVKLISAAFTGSLSYSIAVEAYTGGSNVPPANARVNP